jgi:hypothetical protein
MTVADLERRRRLMDTLGRLSSCQSIEDLVMVLRGSARAIADADGITVVRRMGDRVAYVAEDAACPLWTGQDFPIETCISGIAMLENRPVLIPDIYADDRVPHAAYRATFVHSMAMFPIGMGEPLMAMGAYWRRVGSIDSEAVSLLSSLARSASLVFDRLKHDGPMLRHETIA